MTSANNKPVWQWRIQHKRGWHWHGVPKIQRRIRRVRNRNILMEFPSRWPAIQSKYIARQRLLPPGDRKFALTICGISWRSSEDSWRHPPWSACRTSEQFRRYQMLQWDSCGTKRFLQMWTVIQRGNNSASSLYDNAGETLRRTWTNISDTLL